MQTAIDRIQRLADSAGSLAARKAYNHAAEIVEGRLIMNRAATPEPLSRPGKENVLPAVINDFKTRDVVGRKKYGTTLQTHNGRDSLNDAYQEACDLVMYLKQAVLEGGE